MKKVNLSGAIIAMLSTASYAQPSGEPNISLYGNLDLGLVASNSGAPGAANRTSISSGTYSGSYWGIQGMEDLGSGMKAHFGLEAGFDADTGAMKTYSGNPGSASPTATGGASVNGLFNKRSFVGVSGNFGSISLGRDYTPLYWVSVATDPLKLEMFGNTQEALLLSGTGSDRYGRASNAVFYVSPKLGGFQTRVMYSLGSESGGYSGVASPTTAPPKDANHFSSVSFSYAMAGWVISGAAQQLKLPLVTGSGNSAVFTGATATRRDLIIGTKYNFGDYSLGAGYLSVKQPTSTADGSDIWLGGTAALGTGTVLVEVQRLRQNTATMAEKRATVFSLSYVHPLSKRTSLYASFGELNNNSIGAFALASNDGTIAAGAAGAKVKGLATGIRHRF